MLMFCDFDDDNSVIIFSNRVIIMGDWSFGNHFGQLRDSFE